jgi:hypothetical protein
MADFSALTGISHIAAYDDQRNRTAHQIATPQRWKALRTFRAMIP